jgi:hypothetical protein
VALVSAELAFGEKSVTTIEWRNMTTDDSVTSHEQDNGFPGPNNDGVDWGLLVFLTLGVAALLSPYALIPFVGVYWAAAAAVGVLLVWFAVMQTTCINGGLICSLVALAILSNTIGIVIGATIRFAASLLA